MRKGPGYIASRYSTGIRKFKAAAAGYLVQSSKQPSKVGAYILLQDDDFIRAAGATLAAVNADPRNHFGKYALRRFDK